ncbi:MAG: hypothetical protein IJ996_05470 [Clostridia bacterium]|nr:hypothetical protein [Clostridia bacterium]
MKRIQSKALLLKKRVRTVQGRAKTAGMLYLLGIVLMAVAGAILTLVTNTVVSGTKFAEMPVINAYKAIVDIFKGGVANVIKDAVLLSATVSLLLYVIMLLALVINIFRALAKLGWLFKTKASYTYGFNRNMYAMDDLGKIFSGSFAALILTNLWMVLFFTADNKITLFGYIVLGVGLFFHILCGLIEGKVTLFTTGEKIDEVDREQGLFVYFFRNLIQVAVVGAIVIFFMKVSIFCEVFVTMMDALLVSKNMGWFGSHLWYVIRFAVELFAWIWIMIMIKHATASTEYNREGKYGKGMKNFTVFSMFTFVFAAALLVLRWIGIGLLEGETKGFNLPLLITALAALVGFISDCIFKSRKKKADPESSANPEPVVEQQAAPVPMMPQMPQMPANANMPYQPIYVPVYYPYPYYGMPMQSADGAYNYGPMPAPAHLLPSPSPATAAEEAKVLEEANDSVEVDKPLDPNKVWMVRCPQCGKLLRVREVSPYHRCPACDKVFKLKKYETYVLKD